MLPTKGFFKEIECPYYVSTIKGSCNRPHCHFKHYRNDGDYDYDYTEFMPVEEDGSSRDYNPPTEEENFLSSEDEEPPEVSHPEDTSELSPDVPEESNGADEPEAAPDIPSEEDRSIIDEREFDAQDALLKFKMSLMSSIKSVIESFPKVFGKFINQRDFNKMIDDFIKSLLTYEETEEDDKLIYKPTPIVELRRNERWYKTQLPFIPECVKVLEEPTLNFTMDDLKDLENIFQNDDLFSKESLLTDSIETPADQKQNEQSERTRKISRELENEDTSPTQPQDDLSKKSVGQKRKSISPCSNEQSDQKSSSSSKHTSSSSSSHHKKRSKHSRHSNHSRSRSRSEGRSKNKSLSSKHKSSSSRSGKRSPTKEKKSVDTIVISSESSDDDRDNNLLIDEPPPSPVEVDPIQNTSENDSAKDNKQETEDYNEPEYIRKKKKHRISHIDIFGLPPRATPKTHKSAPLNPLERFKEIQEKYKGLNRSANSTPSPKISHIPSANSILTAQKASHSLSINKNSLLMSDILKRAELKKTIAQTSNKKTGRVAHMPAPSIKPVKPMIQVDGKTRISLVVRQTCLDRIFALYSKYIPPDLARSRSLQVELETYNKCQLAKSYQNSIANNILRIKREQEAFRIGSR